MRSIAAIFALDVPASFGAEERSSSGRAPPDRLNGALVRVVRGLHSWSAMTSHQIQQSRALSWLAIGAIAVLAWMALPVGTGLFLGALIAFTLQPLDQKLRERGLRPAITAAICTTFSTLLVAASVVVIAVLIVSRAITLAEALPDLAAPGGPLQRTAERWSHALVPLHITSDQVTATVRDEAMSLGSSAGSVAASAAGTTFGSLLTLVFMALSTYSVLLYWSALMRHMENLLPFEPRHTHALLDQLRKVGRRVLRGTVFTGIIQGIAAGLVYWVTGVHDPAFWGALTAVASLLPAVGTLLIWVPMGLYLIATQRVGAGLTELALATTFVGLIPDYVIRPRLVGSEKGIPTIVTFVALFGGMEVFGLIGLVLGPVIAAMAVAVLKTYELGHVKATSCEAKAA